ncbi:glycosyl transferase family 2 [Thiorhodococcus drewsii AZ1]|uniref:Glycosyl transferase family 2 n=1 Tax=Thiorhodococcus drewsii AZ1 TaxID=765913 RepID=G2E1N1_9GAMM|nr:glycosyltransferase family 2 protein [Thiorhodococcus drewsii]EGV31089.1 glycosyl transferase family 2 [Thiorhodococcus drewsii AZ1]
MTARSDAPLVTIAVPSFNQGRYLDQALESIFVQDVPVEVYVLDGGSTDESLAIIERWSDRLAGWRSHPDAGQSAAINEGVSAGCAPFVCWLNSDDLLLSGALKTLAAALESAPEAVAVYGRAWDLDEATGTRRPALVARFREWLFANLCLVSQPATLIRRSAWESVGGLDVSLHMAMDYDLWWRLHKSCGHLEFVDAFVAVNREHDQTKTRRQRRLHYREAINVVRRHHGRVPLKWWLAQPYAVWYRSLLNR